jgi:RNA polymerase sigma-70 factor (ECF subfamily)
VTETARSARDAEVVDAVRRCLAGDREAFRTVVVRFDGPVYRLMVRLCGDPQAARDLTQEALLKAFAALAQYDPTRRFVSWLYRIAINACTDRARALRLELHADLEIGDETLRPDHAIEQREREEILQRALLRLPLDYRLVLVLKDVEGLTYDEIAELLGDSIPALKIRVVRARRRLAERIRKTHPELLPPV